MVEMCVLYELTHFFSAEVSYTVSPVFDYSSGLPCGLLSNQPLSIGTFWKHFTCKMLTYFMNIWYTLWPFALFYDKYVYIHMLWQNVILSPFWYFLSRKIWQPCFSSGWDVTMRSRNSSQVFIRIRQVQYVNYSQRSPLNIVAAKFCRR
jgi:hypothetical protein